MVADESIIGIKEHYQKIEVVELQLPITVNKDWLVF